MKFTRRPPPLPKFANPQDEAAWLAMIQRRYGPIGAEAMYKFSIRLQRSDIDWARELAESTGVGHHDLIRRALHLGLKALAKEEKRK